MHPSRRFGWLMAAVLLLVAFGFWQQWRLRQPPVDITFTGQTMGTVYSVRIAQRPQVPIATLRAQVEARLGEVNASMSTWDPQSEISRINDAPAGKALPLSDDLRTVLTAALALSRATDGAFDPTIGPVVSLWGFGPHPQEPPPTPAAVRAALQRVGYQSLRLDDAGLTKLREGVTLDLSAIAKGFGVDAVARVLEAQGITDYLVEIGGDLVVRGHNPHGEPWSVGIEKPVPGALRGEALTAVVRIDAGGLATSGSYRRFRRFKERQSHHIIDPRTGQPTQLTLVSVSVRARDCMTADGIATALMVLGVDDGLAWVDRRADVEALFLEQIDSGALVRHASKGFPPLAEPR